MEEKNCRASRTCVMWMRSRKKMCAFDARDSMRAMCGVCHDVAQMIAFIPTIYGITAHILCEWMWCEWWKEANLITYWSKRHFRRGASTFTEKNKEVKRLKSHVRIEWIRVTRIREVIQNERRDELKLLRRFDLFGGTHERNAIIIKTCYPLRRDGMVKNRRENQWRTFLERMHASVLWCVVHFAKAHTDEWTEMSTCDCQTGERGGERPEQEKSELNNFVNLRRTSRMSSSHVFVRGTRKLPSKRRLLAFSALHFPYKHKQHNECRVSSL